MSNSNNSLVSVVIPTYDREYMLKRLIMSVHNSDYPQSKIEFVIVDGWGNLKQNELPIRSTDTLVDASNDSLAKCRNIGMKESTGEFILIIDDDNVIEADTISHLVSAINQGDNIGAAAPFQYYLSNKELIWCGGCRRSKKTTLSTFIGHNTMDKGQYSGTFDIDDAPNAIIIKADVIQSVGLHQDIKYPIEFEHCEYFRRVKKRGYRIVSSTEAKVYHDISPNEPPRFDNKDRMYQRAKNRIYYQKEFESCINIMIFYLFLPLLVCGYIYKFFRYSESPFVISRAYLKGTIDGLRSETTIRS